MIEQSNHKMKKVLFLQNITLEGPGQMEMFLTKRNISYEICDLYAGCALPTDLSAYGAVVVLGGPMNVDEEERYSFLSAEKCLLRKCIQQRIPILGICLGAQLLARVLGAKVYKNEFPEIGCMKVVLTEDGRKSPLFGGISSPDMSVFQWHGDTYDLADEALHLAKSTRCRHQVFSKDNRFFGVQFHIEVSLADAKKWAESYGLDLHGDERESAQAILEMKEGDWPQEIAQSAEQVFRNFFLTIAKMEHSKQGEEI